MRFACSGFSQLVDLNNAPLLDLLQLYTCLPRVKLVEYIGTLELLAADRQETFFKIDVDVEWPPHELRANGWWVILHSGVQ